MHMEEYGNIERPFKGGFKDLGWEPQWTTVVSFPADDD